MADVHMMTREISAFTKHATNEEVKQFVMTSFSLVRGGLNETGRMEYDWDDPLYVALNKAESSLREAMRILVQTKR